MDDITCIFDLDGTLLDSMHVWDKFAVQYLKGKGIYTNQALDQLFEAMRMEEAIDYLHTHYLPTLTKETISREVYELLCDCYRSMRLKPGVKECVTSLHQKGIRMGVLSANHVAVCEAALKKHGLLEFFSFIVSCEQLHLSKEDPTCFLQACEMMKMKKEHTLIIEDALHAIQGAKKAGFYVVAVKERSQNKDEKEIKQCADTYIEDMRELEEMICKR